jgi:hypothetical protein
MRNLIISPPLRGGDKGEGDVCGFTNDLLVTKTFNFKQFSVCSVVNCLIRQVN